MDDALKVKRCVLVLTSHGAIASSKGRTQEEEQAFSNHVTMQEVNELDSEIELIEATKAVEDGGKPD